MIENNRTRILLISFLISLAIVIISLAVEINSIAYADVPCLHGMRIVGDESIYISHMGLFNDSCHDYQGIFEVDFSGENNPQQKYLNAQKTDPDKNEFTLRPQSDFILPDLGSGQIKSFQADLFEGQYERPQTQPKKIADNLTVTVKRVLHFRKFNSAEKLPPNLEYLLFGNSKEQYVAHRLTKPNDFDQILAVKSPFPLSDKDLSNAISVVFPNRPIKTEQEMFALALASNDSLKPTIQISGKPNQQLEVGSQYFREKCDYRNNPPLPPNCPLTDINNLK